jgi:hypothetical protein
VPGPPQYRDFTNIPGHTTLGRTPLDEYSARRRDLYLTTHNTHKRQTSMPLARFEPTIPASERRQTHALDDGHWDGLGSLISSVKNENLNNKNCALKVPSSSSVAGGGFDIKTMCRECSMLNRGLCIAHYSSVLYITEMQHKSTRAVRQEISNRKVEFKTSACKLLGFLFLSVFFS